MPLIMWADDDGGIAAYDPNADSKIGRWCKKSVGVPDLCDRCFDPVTLGNYPATGYIVDEKGWRIGTCERCHSERSQPAFIDALGSFQEAGKLTVSQWLDPFVKMSVLDALLKSDHLWAFYEGLFDILMKANRFETIDVHFWYNPFVYVDVVDSRWQHYPCSHRALVSFDLAIGKWASFLKSDNRYVYARRGWGRFMDALVNYKVPRYRDCGDKEKTTSC